MTFKFEIVSPERILMAGDAESAVLPGAEGDFMVLPRHAPVLSTLRPGVIDVTFVDASAKVFVKSGLVEVDADSCTVLARQAYDVAELSAERIAEEIAIARSELSEAGDDELAKATAQQVIEQLQSLAGGVG